MNSGPPPVRFSVLKKLLRFVLAEEGSVKTRVVRSGMWVGAFNIVGSVLGILRSIVLARLMTPEMFGLMGIASIAIRAIDAVTRPGVAQALVARQKPFDEAAATGFTLLVMRGLLLAVVLSAAAPLVAVFYDADTLQPMLQALSAVFVIGGFSNINTIAMQKELNFRRLTYLSFTTTLLGTIITIAAAFWLRSVWALVIGQVASAGLSTLLSYNFIAGQVRLSWNAEIARELLRYGKFITGSSLLLFIAMELDSAVIGKLLGVEQLGFYALAFTIANLATANLSKAASSILMPAYSQMQSDRAALQRAYLRTLSLVMFAVLPATAGMMLLAEPLIVAVYGQKWLSATPPLQILAVFGLARALAALSGYLFEGMGLPKVAFQLGLLRLVVVAPLIVPMTSSFGLQGAAVTVTFGMAVQWLISLVYLNRHLQITASRILSACWHSIWTATIMSLVIFALMRVVPSNTMLGFVVVVAVGITAYCILNFTVLRELGNERMS